ncbi:phage tail protein, partial [Salmonella enterica subsp. enterica serovar Kentucky]|nr:phage tail protein [Salmonella enterica subsp. enterica serovar Kentucky]
DPNVHYRLALRNGEVVGMISLHMQFHLHHANWIGEIQELVVLQAIELHKYKGTPWAVRRVLEILSLPGTISEWFEYGGKAYFFK